MPTKRNNEVKEFAIGTKTAIQRHLRFASFHHNSNVNIERDFKV